MTTKTKAKVEAARKAARGGGAASRAAAQPYRTLDVGDLFVDYASDGGYQRDRHETRAMEIAEDFKPHLFEPIHVAPRQGGRFAVIEGQTRYWVAIALGHRTIKAIVHAGLQRKDEAMMFVELTKGRRAPGPFDTYRARLCAGDPQALEIQEIVDRCGWELFGGGNRRGKSIAAVKAVETVLEIHGAAVLEQTLWMLDAWAEEERPSGAMVQGMGTFVAEHGSRLNKAAREKLARTALHAFERKGRMSGEPGDTVHKLITGELVRAYNRGRRTRRV